MAWWCEDGNDDTRHNPVGILCFFENFAVCEVMKFFASRDVTDDFWSIGMTTGLCLVCGVRRQ
jgi:hypothetical protein